MTKYSVSEPKARINFPCPVAKLTINEKAHGFSDTFVNMQCFYADYQGDIQANAEIAEFKWIGEQEFSLCALAAQKAMRFIML